MNMFDNDQSPPGSRREASKLETRNRVLTAARELFAEEGFANATIRKIADRAGVAPGSVFTTFANKDDVLATIIAEKYRDLARRLEAAVPPPGADRRMQLKHLFDTAYGFEFDRLPLIVSQIGASWSWSREFEAFNRSGLAPIASALQRILEQAIAQGELRADTDVPFTSDLLFGVYLRNYRLAWYEDLPLEEVCARMHRQIDVIFDGVALRN
jgi:AcrR family transcriptional regulator